MSRKSTSNITISSKKAFTLIEFIFSGIFIAIIIAALSGTFMLAAQCYLSNSQEMALQREVNIVLKILSRGVRESTSRFGLDNAVSYEILDPNNAVNFSGMDGQVRRYYLDAAKTSILCLHPDSSSEVIYTAPADTIITMTFTMPPDFSPSSGVIVTYKNLDLSIYIALSRNIGLRNVVASASTTVNIRNHSL